MAKKMVNIRLDEDLWKQAKMDAARQGFTLQEWLTLAIILQLDNSRAEMREKATKHQTTVYTKGGECQRECNVGRNDMS